MTFIFNNFTSWCAMLCSIDNNMKKWVAIHPSELRSCRTINQRNSRYTKIQNPTKKNKLQLNSYKILSLLMIAGKLDVLWKDADFISELAK